MDSAISLQWRSVVPADVPAMTALFAEIEEADQYGWHFDADSQMFRDHWGVTATPPQMWRSRFTGPEFQPELSPLALDAATGEIVGLTITHLYAAETAVTNKRDAHLVNVGTLRRVRGRGIATGLIATMLRAASEHGFDTASLDVDTANPTGALGVYQKSGYAVVNTWVDYARSIS